MIDYRKIKKLGKDASANPERILPFLNRITQDAGARRALEKIRAASVVWHACTPKSASTYLTNYMQRSLRSQNANIHFIMGVPFFENRPQVYCRYQLSHRIEPKRVNILDHLHTLATNDFFEMYSDRHVVICQTRSLFDTIVSLTDHLNIQSPLTPFLPMSYRYWDQLSDEQKLDDMIENYVPWHIAFLQSWMAASNECNVKWVQYSDAVKDPNSLISKVLAKYNISLNGSYVLEQKDMNFNRGISGRGRDIIPSLQQERIAEKVARADYLKQDLTRFL